MKILFKYMPPLTKTISRQNSKTTKSICYEWELQVKIGNKWDTSYQVRENRAAISTLMRDAIKENPHSQIRLIRHKVATF